jgi:hypothetical protein
VNKVVFGTEGEWEGRRHILKMAPAPQPCQTGRVAPPAPLLPGRLSG